MNGYNGNSTPVVEGAVEVGVDLGIEFTYGFAYVALVVGGSVGLQSGGGGWSNTTITPSMQPAGSHLPAMGGPFSYDLNPNLLRVGIRLPPFEPGTAAEPAPTPGDEPSK